MVPYSAVFIDTVDWIEVHPAATTMQASKHWIHIFRFQISLIAPLGYNTSDSIDHVIYLDLRNWAF